MGEWLSCHNAGIIDQKFCREVIGTVNDEIIILDQIHNVCGIYKCAICLDGNIRVDRFHCLRSGFHLCLAHIIGGVDDLSLQVGKIYLIGINNTDRTNTCCSQIKCCRCSESACSDDQNAGV